MESLRREPDIYTSHAANFLKFFAGDASKVASPSLCHLPLQDIMDWTDSAV
jgi:hypothetical protein